MGYTTVPLENTVQTIETTTSIEDDDVSSILSSLRQLDDRLRSVVQSVATHTGREPGADPFRGLYVSEADVYRYLTDPVAMIPAQDASASPLARGSRFGLLRERFELSAFELDTLLLALAPDFDPRYERIFAYLQDDVSRRRPSIDLILSVLCRSAADKLEKFLLFAASRPLRANRLLRLSGDESATVARRELAVDPPIAAFLLGDTRLDACLARFVEARDCTLCGRPVNPGLLRIARRGARANRTSARLYFQGGDAAAKRDAAAGLSAALGLRMLLVDIGRAARHAGDFEAWLHKLAREVLLRDAVVYFDGLDLLPDDSAHRTIWRAIRSFPCIAIVSGARDAPAGDAGVSGLVTIPFCAPDWRDRREAWSGALRSRRIRPRATTLDALAERFRFSRSQIEDAAESAANLAEYRGTRVGAEHLFEAARSRSGHELAALTRKIAPAHGWADIVLPEDATEQLREICHRIARRHEVYKTWGFARKLSSGIGITALFHGHSGTGKTMAAEVVARELQLDLYKIDLAGVVSKYIGETEKNLDRIFTAAENANAILLFDEADSLFGKRSEVRDSHDRYANLEVSYLLQKMEQYEGVSILATNFRQNLDSAFLRRLTFTVQFPFPDETRRRRIWAGIWPPETPLCADVDAAWLAAQFMLSGGDIRNVALAAAFLAIEDGGAVTLSHVLQAVQSEFLKMGKTLTAAESAPPLASLPVAG